MSERKASSPSGASTQVESLEERQWRLKVAQAKGEVASEEQNWHELLERAKTAADNEEREWQRNIARARAKTSGVYLKSQEASTPTPVAKAPQARKR
jgi:hypothetical protein